MIREKAIKQENEYKEKLEMQNFSYDFGCSQEEYESMIREHETYTNRQISPIENVLNSPDLLSKYNKILLKRRSDNTNKLKQYGLLDTKNPTLNCSKNVAFKTLFSLNHQPKEGYDLNED